MCVQCVLEWIPLFLFLLRNTETNTCILGTMYFVERSIHFQSFDYQQLHRSSGFNSNHRSFIAIVLFRMVQIIRPHSSIYILIKKKKKKNDSVHCSIKEALESFFFHFSHFNGIVHVLCLHVLSFSHRKTFRKVLKTSCFAIVWSVSKLILLVDTICFRRKGHLC